MTRTCTDCGASFDARSDRHRLCWPCWRRREDSKRAQAAFDVGYRKGYADGRNAAEWEAGGMPALPSELLRRAVRLCHPDRHPPERADVANAVTAELLGLLGESRPAGTSNGGGR